MADVRSLLRNEIASRRINHPQATYSTTGTLVCLVCHIQLKAESLWNKHLRSPQHAMRLQRIRDGTLGRPPGAPAPKESEPVPMNSDHTSGNSKKRKADEEQFARIKKSKAVDGVSARSLDDHEHEVSESEESEPASTVSQPPKTSKQLPLLPSEALPPSNSRFTSPNTAPTIDETEWAAFERDIASPPPQLSALTSAATISAAPLTAAEIAAHSREEASLQAKEKQEEEIEGEKEDAARQMEEEFDDMAVLEERVRALKQKREALRREISNGGDESVAVGTEKDSNDDDSHETSDDGDDEDDDWDQWGR